MRKLAPIFISSIVALAAGNAFANTAAKNSAGMDSTGSPTVSANTPNQANTSFGDRSQTSPGTNAKMNDKAVTGQSSSVSDPNWAANEDKKEHSEQTATEPTDKSVKKTTKHHKVAKAKKHDTTTSSMRDDTTANQPAPTVDASNPPTSKTNGAAANSTTGKSPGQ
jgi:hypothetical protein